MSEQDTAQKEEYSEEDAVIGLLIAGGLIVAIGAHLYMSGFSDTELVLSAEARENYRTAETFRSLGTLAFMAGVIGAIVSDRREDE